MEDVSGDGFCEGALSNAASNAEAADFGMQIAIVVVPSGEEIHTDEYGRERVQFHWDREGGYDESSSIWMRASQGWAGGEYGMIILPRVGQEVLVSLACKRLLFFALFGRCHGTPPCG